jgi:hypothetical protein
MSSAQVQLEEVESVGGSGHRLGVNGWLIAAGALFVAYPVVRPYSSEVGLAGAQAFGSGRWVLAHTLAMLAFGCLAAGVFAFTPDRMARSTVLVGVGLVLPYYGAETFGLHALGVAALKGNDGTLTGISDLVRNNPVALVMFGLGLIALAACGIRLARLGWSHAKLGSALAAIGLVTYLPQFFGPPWMRIAHGILLAVGLVLLALSRPATRVE